VDANLTELLSFWGGTLVQRNEAFLIGGLDEQRDEPHTIVIRLQVEGRTAKALNWAARSICHSTVPIDEIVVLGLDGEVFSFSNDEFVEEPLFAAKQRTDKTGRLLVVRSIGGRAFAAGYGRQVYRRIGRQQWQSIDMSIPGRQSGQVEVVGFESIDGFDENDIYAVGIKGEIWHFDGQTWRQIMSPTNLRLTGVTCAADGNVYACGQFGILLRGRGDQWEVLHEDMDIRYLWDVCWFEGVLYCASSDILYEAIDGQFGPVPFADGEPIEGGIPTTFFRFSVIDDLLWSIGEKDIVAFNGNSWTRVI